MKVAFTPEARLDLLDIGDRIALDNPLRAESFVDELAQKARSIGSLPRGFPLAPRLEHLQIRRRTHRDYLILYRVEPDRILILRIIHGARDYPSLLGPDA